MKQEEYEKIAEQLYQAEKNVKPISPLTEVYPMLTVQDAYQIQQLVKAKRIAAGERIIGMKIGMTSIAMQKALGVDEPDFGQLTNRMLLLEGQPCPLAELVQPKVEGELAFCLKKDLKGPAVTIADVYNAVDYVVPALEIVDSRIENWKIKLADTVADNGSSGRFVLGSAMTPIEKIDMRLTGMTLEKNGLLMSSGATAEVLGNPAAAVAWLANMVAGFGLSLKAGSIVLSGAVTANIPVASGDAVRASFAGLGSVCVRFV